MWLDDNAGIVVISDYFVGAVRIPETVHNSEQVRLHIETVIGVLKLGNSANG